MRPSPISIVIPVFKPDPQCFGETLQSVLTQTCPPYKLIIVLDGPQSTDVNHIVEEMQNTITLKVRIIRLDHNLGISGATNEGVKQTMDEYVGLLDHDDLLEPNAIEHVISAIDNTTYRPDLIYTDHDKIDINGNRYDPEFKPDWSPGTLLSHCYIGHFKVIRRDDFLRLGGFRKEYDGAQDYDFLLRLAEQDPHVVHIPEILYHWRSSPGSTATSASTKSDSIEQGRRAVQDALTRRKKRGNVILPEFSNKFNIGVYALRFDPKDFTERVTILIPTKDRPDLLEPCIHSIRTQTTYPRYEILVVNNGTATDPLIRFLDSEGVRRLDIPTDAFNFSSLANRAMEHVRTPFVLLLNDDTEVLSEDWLLQMVGTISLDDRIGAVGAKLLFPDGRTQHCGVVLGLNNITAGHASRGLPCDDSGYRNSNRALRNYAAVTAACMLTKTSSFLEVGGFDEQHFPVGYNDVDYCCKLLARGYRVVVQPNALLLHHQSASRGKTFHPDMERHSRAELRRRWFPLLRSDPYYNPNLSRQNEHSLIRSHPPGKRILLASHNLAYEGASLSLLELATALQKRGYSIEVASPKPGPLADAYAAQNISLHIAAEGSPHPLLALHRDAFDILFLNTIAAYELLQNTDVCAHPTIWCIRESERELYTRTLPGFSQNLFSAASRILFVADATRNAYRDLDRGHFRTIYTGIDCSRIDRARWDIDRPTVRRMLGIAASDIVISTVGTVCARKGQKEFVEAALSLLSTSAPPLQFLIVGGGTGSAYEDELVMQIRRNGLRDRIHLIEKTPDVDHFYSISDIFVCNSSIESFPRVILEAMAWMLPIVATDVFGIPEQIRDGTEGLLVPPENPAALTKALRRLLEDPTLRSTLARNARARVEKDFGIDRMVDQYEELFQKLYDM